MNENNTSGPADAARPFVKSNQQNDILRAHHTAEAIATRLAAIDDSLVKLVAVMERMEKTMSGR